MRFLHPFGSELGITEQQFLGTVPRLKILLPKLMFPHRRFHEFVKSLGDVIVLETFKNLIYRF